ncbi:MAG: hypothetical protein Q8P15_01765 [Nanoarchaeota archaeon]|nr:hypothetical protein [Nanoarchaeota archaeon]
MESDDFGNIEIFKYNDNGRSYYVPHFFSDGDKRHSKNPIFTRYNVEAIEKEELVLAFCMSASKRRISESDLISKLKGLFD